MFGNFSCLRKAKTKSHGNIADNFVSVKILDWLITFCLRHSVSADSRWLGCLDGRIGQLPVEDRPFWDGWKRERERERGRLREREIEREIERDIERERKEALMLIFVFSDCRLRNWHAPPGRQAGTHAS
jgi:hypothetical protein